MRSSPVEKAIGRDVLDLYEAALRNLRDEEREAIIARLELGFSYGQVAEALGASSPDAARTAVSRALVRLAEKMEELGS